VIIVSARGGIYSNGPMKSLDYQETYLLTVLGFIELTDVSFVRAEGIAQGGDRDAAMQAAEVQLFAAVQNAA
jgi:FMN-dependent NADH-azoreductase